MLRTTQQSGKAGGYYS